MTGAGRGSGAWLRWLLPLSAVVACSAKEVDSTSTVRVAADSAARVGPEPISLMTVSRIAAAARVEPRAARDRAIRDALFALEARRLFGESGLVSNSERAVYGRALLERLENAALSNGAPTHDEIKALTSERWAELDRPASARTTHAVVLTPTQGDRERARKVAERLAAAVSGITEPERFITAASAVAADGLEIRAERLAAVTADGRVIPGTHPSAQVGSERYDAEFAKAANAIPRVGSQSGIVATDFGFHLILLEERLPAKTLTHAEAARVLAPEIMVRRSRKAHRELLERLRQGTSIELARAAGELSAAVRVSE